MPKERVAGDFSFSVGSHSFLPSFGKDDEIIPIMAGGRLAFRFVLQESALSR
jgi:hypothetical protein